MGDPVDENEEIGVEDMSPEYSVEKIIDKRMSNSGKIEYLLKWKNWSEKHNSWEPIDHVFCPDLIENFEKNRLSNVVEEIIDKRISNSGKIEYYVVTQIKGLKVMKWVSKENLNCTDLIEKFEKNSTGKSLIEQNSTKKRNIIVNINAKNPEKSNFPTILKKNSKITEDSTKFKCPECNFYSSNSMEILNHIEE